MATPQLFDDSNQAVVLGRELGRGGEGAVFEVANASGLVAKLYHKPVTSAKATKLKALVRKLTPELVKVSAWPTATLHSGHGGELKGILLPRIQRPCEIHELYSPADRRVKFPEAKWRFLIRTALNCAVAFEKLHASGIVIGDVNQGNVLVAPNALVRLIDCDSFQINDNGRAFRCEVGVPHFTPPELQGSGIDFAKIDRTANHDHFGLAVLIFHLLFMGRHPFVGRYAGSGDMPIERAIEQYRFAYGRRAAAIQMTPPPYTLSARALPTVVGQLFERAFDPGSELPDRRPPAGEWIQALSQLDQHLAKCDVDIGHEYVAGLKVCPWCDIIRTGGPNFFISVTIRLMTGGTGQLDVAAMWTVIERVPVPDVRRRLQQQSLKPLGAPLPIGAASSSDFSQYLGVACLSVALFCLASLFYPPLLLATLPMEFAFGTWWIVLKLLSPLGRIRRERLAVAARKGEQLRAAAAAWSGIVSKYTSEFENRRKALRALCDQYDGLRSREKADISLLQSSCFNRQRDQYLRAHSVRDASIPLVGAGRKATLASYGVETAFEVEASRISGIPNFGETLTANLLAWRRQVESTFRFDPSKGIPQSDLDMVRLKYFQLGQQITLQLTQGPNQLKAITEAAARDALPADGRLLQLDREWAQAKADVAVAFPERQKLWPIAVVVLSIAASLAVLLFHGANEWGSRPRDDAATAIGRPPELASPHREPATTAEGSIDLNGQESKKFQPFAADQPAIEVSSHPLATRTIDEYRREGVRRRDSGDLTGAIDAYSQGITAYPNAAVLYHHRAYVHNQLLNFPSAIADSSTAAKFKPEMAVAYINRAWANFCMGKYDLTIADCNSAIERDTSNAYAFYLRGRARDALHKPFGADDRNTAVVLDPSLTRFDDYFNKE
jgi:DNA-binding helix-hairpin-helix protein with protein kinase domain